MRLSLLALLAGLLVGAACAEGGDDQSDRAWPALALPHCAPCLCKRGQQG